jgi:hypothetical protein
MPWTSASTARVLPTTQVVAKRLGDGDRLLGQQVRPLDVAGEERPDRLVAQGGRRNAAMSLHEARNGRLHKRPRVSRTLDRRHVLAESTKRPLQPQLDRLHKSDRRPLQ